MALQEGPAPRSAETVSPSAGDSYRQLFGGLIDCGVSIAPSAYEVGFLSLAHQEADIDRLADAVAVCLAP
jgi:glutamate-1-semialdehyde 2,1-aminomutase